MIDHDDFHVAFVNFFFRFYHLIEVLYLSVGPILIQFSDKIEKYFFSQTQRENHHGQS